MAPRGRHVGPIATLVTSGFVIEGRTCDRAGARRWLDSGKGGDAPAEVPPPEEVRMELTLSTRTVAGHRVLDVAGEIDVYTAPQLRERLITLVEDGARRVIVDL